MHVTCAAQHAGERPVWTLLSRQRVAPLAGGAPALTVAILQRVCLARYGGRVASPACAAPDVTSNRTRSAPLFLMIAGARSTS